MSISNGRALPPLDGSITVLPGFLDFHAEQNPNLPFFFYPSADPTAVKPASVSYLEFAHATHRIAHAFRPGRAGPDRAVVAVVVTCDTLLYHALVVGIMRAGLVPFPMSPRNSAPAIANMLERTCCHRVVSQPSLSPLSEAVRASVSEGYELQVDALPTLSDIFPAFGSTAGAAVPSSYPAPAQPPACSDIVLYLHSSGSTGFPKPIPQTDITLLHWVNLPAVSVARVRSLRWGGMALPPFHTMGLTHQVLCPLASGEPTCIFAPRAPAPAVVPTPENTIEAARQTQATAIVSVPTFVEVWSQHDEDVKFLASLRAVMSAGGPISMANGRKLIAAGVPFFSVYGATEFGTLTCLLDTDVDEPASRSQKTRDDWGWMQFPPQCNPRWAPQEDGTYELQLLTCPTHQPSVENLPNGEHGYATSDLWLPHPSKPGLWRVVGRTDDVIVLGSGEKIVPIPQEGHIGAHRMISGVLMFGRGHLQPGVLVEPKPEYAVEPGNEHSIAEFRNAIWWVDIEEANSRAPGFGRIYKEMILVADPARPVIRAAKGTIQRKMTLKLYAADIKELYATVEDSKDSHGIAPPRSWAASDIQAWLTEHAASISGRKAPAPTDDLFERGFDSLGATFLRNRIIGALRSSSDASANAAAQEVLPNFVFTHPTLASLSTAVAQLIDPSTKSASQDPVHEINAMISKYTALLPQALRTIGDEPVEGAVVLVTGTTGNLGAHILAELIVNPHIACVYAHNRGINIADRQRAAFEGSHLPVKLLADPKLVLLSGDLMREDLGLDPAVLDKLQKSVTHIVHNAWRVDFNLVLASFEPHVSAAVRLAGLAPGARFLFTSSVSIAQAWRPSGGRGPVPESSLKDPSLALGHGYGMSKFVVEEVLSNASKTGMNAVTLRIGQISGSAESGAWNTSDWVPSLIKSSIGLGCLPTLEGVVSWVPMDAVARATVDAILHPQPPECINVVHPRPVLWPQILSAVNNELGLNLPVVPLEDWVSKLESTAEDASAKDLDNIPAIKLLEYFRSLTAFENHAKDAKEGEIEVGGLPVFETAKAQSISPALDSLQPLGEEDAKAWIRYWRSKKFIA
ncbi:hypothetical protein BKA93DRAFT_736353 [Sparassis latifolia]